MSSNNPANTQTSPSFHQSGLYYTVDTTPDASRFDHDFNTHHSSAPFKVKATSKNINLEALALKPYVKEIQSSTSITQLRRNTAKLGQFIQQTLTSDEISAEIIPKENKEVEVNLVSTPRLSDPAYNIRIEPDKPTTLNCRYQIRNLFDNFEVTSLGYRRRFSSDSRSLYFRFNLILSLQRRFEASVNWKDKRTTEDILSHSITSRLIYRTLSSSSNSPDTVTLRAQNRSSETVRFDTPKDIETSNLFEVSFSKRMANSNFELQVQPSIGVVPTKKSYFGKLSLSLNSFHWFKSDYWLETKTKVGLMWGKNVIPNDLFEYRPMNRAKTYIRNKTMLYLPLYPHTPLAPLVRNIPYTFVSQWVSYDPKRGPNRAKYEAQLGVGVTISEWQNNAQKLYLDFSFLKLKDGKPVWSPKISLQLGDIS